ncbi:MAG: tryptophan synthase subunit alpha, partial [Gammaproteobacteria bacterium]|nr:tryptophan synthase subunit alpha [Gammaproteobacteria bacterium]
MRIDACFENARKSGKTVLIPFVTAGDPLPALTVAVMHRLVEGGADLIELGIPFSDPMADGPVIQASSERAIERGVDLEQVLSWVRQFRDNDAVTPIVLMGYMNPIERFGVSRFSQAAHASGVDGLLMVDCPPEEMTELQDSLSARDIDIIRLVAPTTSETRCRMITRHAKGFVYYVSFKGTTGAGSLDTKALA